MAEEVKPVTGEQVNGTPEGAMPEEKPTDDKPDNKESGDGNGDGIDYKAELEAARAQITKLNHENEKRRLAQKKADEEKLAADGKLKELADLREQERDAVTAERDQFKEKFEQVNKILNADIDKRIEKWPEEVKVLVPAADAVSAAARAEQVSKLQPLADKIANAAARPGNPAGPTHTGAPTNPEIDRNARIGQRRTIGYG